MDCENEAMATPCEAIAKQREAIINPIDRLAASDKKSYKMAIAAKCAECVGCTPGYTEPGFREEIRRCSSYTCPLRPYRPYK